MISVCLRLQLTPLHFTIAVQNHIMKILCVCPDDVPLVGPHIICEYCPGEDIMTYLLDCPGGARRFSENEVRHFFCQLIRGVQCMHDANRAHRDLKPDNLMFDDLLQLKIGGTS